MAIRGLALGLLLVARGAYAQPIEHGEPIEHGGAIEHGEPGEPQGSAETAQPVFDEADAGPQYDIRTGVVGMLRIDGKGRGFAAGLGIAIAPLDAVELEVVALRSSHWGVYAGLRVRFLAERRWRPYVGFGVPAFVFRDEAQAMGTGIAFGLRGAGGIEVQVAGAISAHVDLGLEYFINVDGSAIVDGKRPDRTVFVPTVGVIGRL
jgi:hypothetical protein